MVNLNTSETSETLSSTANISRIWRKVCLSMRTTGRNQGYTVSVFFFNRKTEPSQDWLEQVYLISRKLDILWPTSDWVVVVSNSTVGMFWGYYFFIYWLLRAFAGNWDRIRLPKTVPQHWTGVNPDIKQLFYLWHGLLIMLYKADKVVQTFEYVNVVLKCDHAIERYWGSFCCARLFKSFAATVNLK